MAKNPSVSELDPSHISRYTYDSDNDSVRVSIGSAEFVVSGEGVSASGTMTQGSSGSVVATVDCSGTKEFQLYAVAQTATTGAVVVRLDVSPDATDNVFYETSATLTLPISSIGNIVVSPLLNTVIAKRCKITIVSNALAASEIVKVYIIGNTF
jgi:hypothetical protein